LGGWVGLEEGHIHAGVDRLFEWLEAGLGLQLGWGGIEELKKEERRGRKLLA
jgi:hypothetical protein